MRVHSPAMAGYVNISLEDTDTFGITRQEINAAAERQYSPSIRSWREAQARKGLALLEEYSQNTGNLSLKARIGITLPFNLPARRDFYMRLIRK